YLASLWGREFFFDSGDHFRAAVVSDDNPFVAHISDPVCRSYKSARRSIPMRKSPTPRTSFPRSSRLGARLSKQIAARGAWLVNAAARCQTYDASRLTCSHTESRTIYGVVLRFRVAHELSALPANLCPCSGS